MAISCFAVPFIVMVLTFPPEALRMSVKAIELDLTQLECTAKIQQLERKITQITQEVAAVKSCACSSPGTTAHTLIKPVTSKSIALNGSGKGTSQDPYKIANIEDLQKLRSIWKYNLGKYFIVTQNINLSSIANFAPLPPFEGILDGNNKKILHLKIDGTHLSTQSNTGLFETIASTGQVKNLKLENVLVKGTENVGGLAGEHSGRIDSSYVSGQVLGTRKVGGLVGSSDTGSRITDSYATTKISGLYYVGGLVGYLFRGTIESSQATGTVSAIGNTLSTGSFIGGLVGHLLGTIQSSYATGNVSGWNHIGGLVGVSNSGYHSKINNSYATGNVSGVREIGGLVGENRLGSTITKCYAKGQVSGVTHTGGLVGQNIGRIDDSYVTGQVLGTKEGPTYIGGLVGRSDRGSRITDSYSTAKVSGTTAVGGLVGQLIQGTIQSSYATGTVSAKKSPLSAGDQIGGLVGHLLGTIQSSYATGNVSGRWYIGGLVGLSSSVGHSKINNSYATGNVSGVSEIGGLVGENRLDSTITKCYAKGQVSGLTRTGGLVGKNIGRIDDSYVTGQVLGTKKRSSYIGGLVGRSDRGSRITNSYATAKVSGTSSVGGLVGLLFRGTIQSCYATGTVSGKGNTLSTEEVGGLVGRLLGTIQSSFATGNVSGWNRIGGLVGVSESGHHSKINNSYATGSVSGREFIGGLVGENRLGSTITKCYAIGQVSGRDEIGGLVGKNTGRIENSYGKQQRGTTNTLGAKTNTELKTPSTFTGWDTRIWKLTQNQYPKLKRLD